jgi:hypothetical protein
MPLELLRRSMPASVDKAIHARPAQPALGAVHDERPEDVAGIPRPRIDP